MFEWLDRYMEHEKPRHIKVLDLAAGSGEATEVLLSWKSTRWPPCSPLPAPPASPLPPPTLPPRQLFPDRRVVRPTRPSTVPTIPEPVLAITASDPFTSPAYLARTSLPCLELSFADVAAGLLPTASPPNEEGSYEEEDRFDIVVVSFALHLVPTTSELWALLTELSKRSRWLIVTAPHKKPDVRSAVSLTRSGLMRRIAQIKPSWGWRRWDPTLWIPAEGRGNVGGKEGDGFEIVLDRTRLRCWRSEERWHE